MNNTGLLLIDKPVGVTSFGALGAVKRALGTKKVGHTGTLDKFASGLMVVLSGSMTRLNPLFTGMDKEYLAEVQMGAETATLDPEGEVCASADIVSEERIRAVLDRFRGEILQVPPAFSAIHVGGKRAYERVLSGEAVEIPPRRVVIRELTLEEFVGDRFCLRVRCSKGTYIRSLARDLCIAAGTRGHLLNLRRTAVGPFRVEDAKAPGDLDPSEDLRSGPKVFEPLEGIGIWRLESDRILPFLQGKVLEEAWFSEIGDEVSAAVFSDGGRFRGVVERDGDRLKYRFVVPDPEVL